MTLIQLPIRWCMFDFDPPSGAMQPARLCTLANNLLTSCGGEFAIRHEFRNDEFGGCNVPVPYAKFESDADAAIFKLKHL